MREYLVLATTVDTILQFPDSLADIREQIRLGYITNLVVLGNGKFNRRMRRKLEQSFILKGHPWIVHHLLFKHPEESQKVFVKRVCKTYEVTNFVDINKANFISIVSDHTLKDLEGYFLDKNDEWKTITNWLKKTNPQYFAFYKKDSEAFKIINTGVCAHE